MADSKSHIRSTYPLPAYNYRVTIVHDDETSVLSFSEVSGLNLVYDPVTYKHGFSFLLGDKIIPGMPQTVRLTLKRGITSHRTYLTRWIKEAYESTLSTGSKRDILVDLCDQSGTAVVRWRVLRAMPVKLKAPTFNATTNEVAIEEMELIAHSLQVDFDP